MNQNQVVSHARSESGQVMVLLALSFVVLVGFTALAIDGGMLFTDRRHAQNAADSASLAGASAAAYYMRENNVNYNAFICGTLGASQASDAGELAAVNNAVLNDYILDLDISDNHGVTVRCEIADLGSYEDKHLDVVTKIIRETSTSFAHLVYDGPAQNQVEAIARVYPPAPLGFGKAIIALNESACSGNQNGLVFSGTSDTRVTGGGVWSNGCLTGNGTGFTVTVNNGGVGFAGDSTGTLSNIHPVPQYIPSPLPHYSTDVNEPNCAGLPNRTAPSNGNVTLEPGIYDEIHWTVGNLTLSPGLYCISGNKGLSIQGGSVYGNGVTIFLQTGGAVINGGVEPVDLRAPLEYPDPSPAIPGILMYMAQGNSSDVNVNGNSTSFYLGTVYAPDGNLFFAGVSDTNPTFNTQLIGYNVEVSGGALIDINFIDDENFEKPPYMDLLK